MMSSRAVRAAPALPGECSVAVRDTDAEQRAREANALVEAAKTGDARAFSLLVRRYRPRIFALALHLTGSRSDADDITQDAFLRAYRNLASFEGRSEFFTWLYRITLHRALNVKRDRKRRPTVDFEDARVEIAAQLDSGGDPRRAMELREAYQQLVAAFDRLSPVLRTTVVLTTLQGLSHKEAAVVLETTEGTIAWRVHEARAQIRRTLESGGAPSPAPIARKPVPAAAARAVEGSLAQSLAGVLALLEPA
jgi:RNA polymerase sigma-70 factor (ECF subfamily)